MVALFWEVRKLQKVVEKKVIGSRWGLRVSVWPTSSLNSMLLDCHHVTAIFYIGQKTEGAGGGEVLILKPYQLVLNLSHSV